MRAAARREPRPRAQARRSRSSNAAGGVLGADEVEAPLAVPNVGGELAGRVDTQGAQVNEPSICRRASAECDTEAVCRRLSVFRDAAGDQHPGNPPALRLEDVSP